MNWFEGGRRISYLIQGLIAAGGLAYVLFASTGNGVTFEVTYPTENFRLTYQPCAYPDISRNVGYKVEFNEGDGRDVELCFRSGPNGIFYRTYTIDPPPPMVGNGTMPRPIMSVPADPYDDRVQAYIDRRIMRFRSNDSRPYDAFQIFEGFGFVVELRLREDRHGFAPMPISLPHPCGFVKCIIAHLNLNPISCIPTP